MNEVVLDSLIDSLKLLPYLAIVYCLIEILEKKTALFLPKLLSYKKASIFVGAGLGAFPQCGFGVISTKLYSKGMISLSTLVAIYVSTSDEAFAILISQPKKLMVVILIKVVLAVVAGFLVSLIKNQRIKGVDNTEECTFGCCNHEIGSCNNHAHQHGVFKKYIMHPLLHTLTVFLFVFVVNLAFGSLIYFVGEQAFVDFMSKHQFLQPLVCALVGLIPNCASSVIISQMFLLNQLSLGGVIAGLTVNAGVAYVLLIKSQKMEAIKIMMGIFAYGVFAGLVIQIISLI